MALHLQLLKARMVWHALPSARSGVDPRLWTSWNCKSSTTTLKFTSSRITLSTSTRRRRPTTPPTSQKPTSNASSYSINSLLKTTRADPLRRHSEVCCGGWFMSTEWLLETQNWRSWPDIIKLMYKWDYQAPLSEHVGVGWSRWIQNPLGFRGLARSAVWPAMIDCVL
jgi:hypothetical protein